MSEEKPRTWVINVKLRDVAPKDFVFDSVTHWASDTFVPVIEKSAYDKAIHYLKLINEGEAWGVPLNVDGLKYLAKKGLKELGEL